MLPGADRVPGRPSEVVVAGGVLARLKRARGDAVLREVGNRIAVELVEQKDVLAVGDPGSPKRTRIRRRSDSA